MMKLSLRAAQRGTSVLEAGAALLALSVFVTAVSGVVDVMNKSTRVHGLVNWAITDKGLRPLLIESADGDSEAALRIDHSGMRDFLESVRMRVEQEMAGESFGFESTYGVLEINPQTGAISSFDSGVARSIGAGQAAFPPNLESCPEMNVMLSEVAQRQRDGGLSDFAFPSGTGEGFVEKAVVVGVRLYRNIEGSFAGNVLRELGFTPGVYSCKTAVMRGDFK